MNDFLLIILLILIIVALYFYKDKLKTIPIISNCLNKSFICRKCGHDNSPINTDDFIKQFNKSSKKKHRKHKKIEPIKEEIIIDDVPADSIGSELSNDKIDVDVGVDVVNDTEAWPDIEQTQSVFSND